MRTYTRDDVQTHSDGFRPSRPAVNVKVYKQLEDVTLPLCLGGIADPVTDAEGNTIGTKNFRWTYTEPEFTHDWIRANVDERTLDSYFWQACEDGVEMIQEDAREILDANAWQEGRSGGWIVVDGLPDLEDWDAVQLAKWRKFEKIARAYADDVPRSAITSIYMNEYEFARDEDEEAARAARQDIATLERNPS